MVLFQCMQSALSMVYDREAGVMQVMLVSPLPRTFLLLGKIVGATVLSLLQAFAFLALARLFGFGFPALGYLAIIPAIVLAGLLLGSIGLLVSVYTRQLENFAGMMNFVVFPMFFCPRRSTRCGSCARPGPSRSTTFARQPVHPRGRAHPLCGLMASST